MHVDSGLIKRCKKQDKRAFAALFKQCENYVYHICCNYTQNEADALAIARDVYIQVIKEINKLNNKMSFRTWLRKIIVSACLNHRKTQKNLLTSLYMTLEDEKKLDKIASSAENIEAILESADVKTLILKYMGQLSERQRMVIILRYDEGLNHDKIALLMKVPTATVQNDLLRVRNILKAKLADTLLR